MQPGGVSSLCSECDGGWACGGGGKVCEGQKHKAEYQEYGTFVSGKEHGIWDDFVSLPFSFLFQIDLGTDEVKGLDT